MPNILISLSVLTVVLAGFVSANPDAGFPKSHEVHPDLRVTFRVIAPKAKSVEVSSSMNDGKQAMTQSENGIWEVTVGPVSPGIYDYTFRVDGTLTLDPHNRWIKGWRRSANLLEIPGMPPKIWEAQPVPHGTVHRHLIHSDLLDRHREFFVYTPPSYREQEEPLPVLFLLHGSGDDASAWTNVGRAHLIADNSIARGTMNPMVIVMPQGHGSYPDVDLGAIDDKTEWFRENNRAVEDSLFDEVVPFVAEHYRVRPDAAGRAIAGLSMGGGQALQFGLNRPDQFSWIAGFSSATPIDVEAAEALFPSLSQKPEFQLVWIGCGKADFLLERNQFFHGWLDEVGIEHTWRLTEGNHSWPVWRDYLVEVLPLFFRQ